MCQGCLLYTSTSYVQFNLTDDVMSNVNMRKAISLAMNRSALTDNILADGSAPGFGLVADGMSGDGELSLIHIYTLI